MSNNKSSGTTKLVGGINTLSKQGNTIHRPIGPWSDTVHRLLKYVRSNGFLLAPEFLGKDNQGNEILTFINGEVSGYPISESARSIKILKSAASTLRKYHDSTLGFTDTRQDVWQAMPREPLEVICHGDYGPHNCVIDGDKVVGVIDFEFAHPGSRVWDVAYAVYRFAPLTTPANKDGFGSLREQARRMNVFCDSYKLQYKEILIDTVIERLEFMAKTITEQAKQGNKAYQNHIKAGHVELYLNDKEYIKQNREHLIEALKY